MPVFVPCRRTRCLPHYIYTYPQYADELSTPMTPAAHAESLSMPPQSPPQSPLQSPLMAPAEAATPATPTNSAFGPLVSSPPNALDAVQTSPPQPEPRPADVQLPPSPQPDHDVPSSSRPPARAVRGSSLPSTVTLPFRPRTQSPARPLVRPQSSGGVPLMQRAHSSPGVDSSGRFIAPPYTGMPRRPTSPLQMGRRRNQFGSYAEELYMGTPSRVGLPIEPNIPEHEELELPEGMIQQASPIPAFASTFPKPRRRTASVLHQSASAPSLHARAISPSPNASHSRSASPSIGASRYANEVYPGSLFGSTSSMPSTPTSMRSRSPSISSLETIEDSPDAEEQAMLEEEEARQKAAEEDGGEGRRKSTGEARVSALRSNKERKRWSVCGAERRADFSLEVIEEQEEKGAGPAYDLSLIDDEIPTTQH